jgi:hypothetical protein
MRRRVTLALVVFAASVGAASVAQASPPPAGPRAHAPTLSWGGARFRTRAAFDRWLRPRSLSYSHWARLHPAGRRILAGEVPPPAATTPTSTSGPVPVSPTTIPAPPPLAAAAPVRHEGESPLLLALIAAGLLLGAVALLPVQRFAPRSPRLLAVAERRLVPTTAAIAILLGVVIAKLAS